LFFYFIHQDGHLNHFIHQAGHLNHLGNHSFTMTFRPRRLEKPPQLMLLPAMIKINVVGENPLL
jgi:hypothetical protein